MNSQASGNYREAKTIIKIAKGGANNTTQICEITPDWSCEVEEIQGNLPRGDVN